MIRPRAVHGGQAGCLPWTVQAALAVSQPRAAQEGLAVIRPRAVWEGLAGFQPWPVQEDLTVPWPRAMQGGLVVNQPRAVQEGLAGLNPWAVQEGEAVVQPWAVQEDLAVVPWAAERAKLVAELEWAQAELKFKELREGLPAFLVSTFKQTEPVGEGSFGFAFREVLIVNGLEITVALKVAKKIVTVGISDSRGCRV